MRIVISGSRVPKKLTPSAFIDWHAARRKDLKLALGAFEALIGRPITSVVSGEAGGIDALAREWCWWKLGKAAHVPMPADWDKYGPSAGHLRNQAMLDLPTVEGFVALWDDKSPGTRDAIRRASAKLEVAPGFRLLVWHYNQKDGGLSHGEGIDSDGALPTLRA